jgi:hypothetical protein
MKSGLRWSIIGITLIILLALLVFAKENTLKRKHREFELTGKTLFKTYCMSCHVSVGSTNKYIMKSSEGYMQLDNFGQIMMDRHKDNFKNILFESDIEPLYRFLSIDELSEL